MKTLARKIIDKIQNTLVVDLVGMVVWPMASFWWLWTGFLTPEKLDWRWGASIFLIVVAPIFLAWLLSALAKDAPGASGSAPHDRWVQPASNGFEVWNRPPVDGLRPSAFMRTLVDGLGATDSSPKRPRSRLMLAVIIVLILVLLALAFFPAAWTPRLPWLAIPQNRLHLGQACLVVLTLFHIRIWATDQKRRLASQDQPPVQTTASAL